MQLFYVGGKYNVRIGIDDPSCLGKLGRINPQICRVTAKEALAVTECSVVNPDELNLGFFG